MNLQATSISIYWRDFTRQNARLQASKSKQKKNHQISSTGITENLQVRPVSCYDCDRCLEEELENYENTNLIGKYQTVEMKISESHNERMEHQEDEQTDIDIRTLITKNNSVVAVYGDDPEY